MSSHDPTRISAPQTPEQETVDGAILEHAIAVHEQLVAHTKRYSSVRRDVSDYKAERASDHELSEMTQGSFACTAELLNGLTGRQNGDKPFRALVSTFEHLTTSSSMAITAIPVSERPVFHAGRAERAEQGAKLLAALMATYMTVESVLDGDKPNHQVVTTISDQLGLQPETRLKWAVGRRAKQRVQEAAVAMTGSDDREGIEAVLTVVQTSILTVNNILQIAELGSHLSNLELDIPNVRHVLKDQAIKKAFQKCKLQDDLLVATTLSAGIVDPQKIAKQREDLGMLTDALLSSKAVSDGVYTQRVRRTWDMVRLEREIAHSNAAVVGLARSPEQYQELMQTKFIADSEKATYRHRKKVQEHSEYQQAVKEAVDTAVTELTQQDESEQMSTSEASLSEVKAERIAELRAKIEELSATLGAIHQDYEPSSSKLKASGLRELQYDLRNGFNDIDAGIAMDGVDRDFAQSITQMLHSLGEKYKQKDEAALRFGIAYDLGAEVQIISAIQSARDELYAMGENGVIVPNTDLCERFDWISENHEAIRAIIANTLPSKAAFYNTMLDRLLDMSDREALDTTETKSNTTLDQAEPITDEESIDLEPGLDAFIPLHETDVAEQLDWEVFPPEVTLREIQRLTEGKFREADAANIEWSRIADLLQISQAYGGTMYRAKPRSLGTAEPYFVVEAEIHGKSFAIAENPQYGNATYVLRTDRAFDGVSWKEVFEQSREFARLLGAERIVHSDKRAHLERIMSNIQSQLLVKANQDA